MKILTKGENLCAVGLVLAFLLPWVSIGGFFTIAGYKIPDIVRALSGLGSALQGMMGQPGEATASTPAWAYLLYLLYLIPLLAILFLVRASNDQPRKGIGIVASLLPLATFAFVIIKGGTDVFKGLGIGAYLTIACAIGLLVFSLKPSEAAAVTPGASSFKL
jgi:hypothetical protein